MRRDEVIETVIIFIAIGSIWLLTLGYTSPLVIAFCIIIIAALCVIAVKRWKRFKKALDEERKRMEMMTGIFDYEAPPKSDERVDGTPSGDDGNGAEDLGSR